MGALRPVHVELFVLRDSVEESILARRADWSIQESLQEETEEKQVVRLRIYPPMPIRCLYRRRSSLALLLVHPCVRASFSTLQMPKSAAAVRASPSALTSGSSSPVGFRSASRGPHRPREGCGYSGDYLRRSRGKSHSNAPVDAGDYNSNNQHLAFKFQR